MRIIIVALLAVSSALSRTSNVMLGSMSLAELWGGAQTVFCDGSGVYWRANMSSSSTSGGRGLCGASDADKFLRISILGGGSSFVFVGFPSTKNKRKRIGS